VAAVADNLEGTFLLFIWRMKSPLHVTYLTQLQIDGDKSETVSLAMDERYITVIRRHSEQNRTLHFVSTKTLTNEWTEEVRLPVPPRAVGPNKMIL
jgi:hypothetical protein